MPDPTPTPTALNSTLVRRRRLELGMSERDLARHLGVSSIVVFSLERDLNHADLQISTLLRLATALAIDPGDLFHPTVARATHNDSVAGLGSADGSTGGEVEGVRAVGALLMTAGKGVPLTVLAEVTGWTLDRVATAADNLERTLAPAGLTLLRFFDNIRIVPATNPVTADEVQKLLRASWGRTGMNLRQASMLYRVSRGEATGAEQRNSDRVAIAELVNAGLAEFPAGDRGARPRLSDDTTFSLTGTRHG